MDQIQEFLSYVTVVDVETTSDKPEELSNEIVQVASGSFDQESWIIDSQLVRPVRDIPPESSAIHHITNRMVRNFPTFEQQIDRISELLQIENTVFMVAHNAVFDLQVLENSYNKAYKIQDFEPFNQKHKWICTWRLAKQLFPEAKEKGKSSLSYLRYRLDLDVPDDVPAHRADADVLTCGRLLEKLIQIGVEDHKIKLDSDTSIREQLISLCWDTIKIDVWPFGKHQGKKLKDTPQNYLVWAIDNMDLLKEDHPNYDPDLANSIADIIEERL